MNSSFTVPHVTGLKVKATRLYIEGLISFIEEKRYCSIIRMELDYFDFFLKNNDYTRNHCMQIRSNQMNRVMMVWYLENKDTMTRDRFFNSRDFFDRLTIEEFISYLKKSLDLPKEWSRDVVHK